MKPALTGTEAGGGPACHIHSTWLPGGSQSPKEPSAPPSWELGNVPQGFEEELGRVAGEGKHSLGTYSVGF